MTDRISIADPQVSERAKERVQSVLDSGNLADGKPVRQFESEFADFCGASHGVAASNGTAALHAALEAVGVGEGDTVVTSPFSFVATANAIRFAGATPRFADIDPTTYNLDPSALEDLLRTGDVDAIVAVHLYGLPADMTALSELASAYDVPLVEDAAQAHGATVDGERVGSLGDVACFSFYPTKNMTTGEGGMVTTDDPEVADAAARFVNHGRATDGYEHVELGHNFRMTSMAAAIGREQLNRLPSMTEARRRNALRYDDRLASTSVQTPVEPAARTHVYHQYTVRVDNRASVVEALDDHGIGAGTYYPTCIHEQPAYDHVSTDAPRAERAADEVLSLPVHPGLSRSDVDRVIDVLTDVVEQEAAHV